MNDTEDYKEISASLNRDLQSSLNEIRPALLALKSKFKDDPNLQIVEDRIESVSKALERMNHYLNIEELRGSLWKKIKVNSAIELSLVNLKEQIKRKNIEIRIVDESKSKTVIYGDNDLMAKFVFDIVLENAIKFSPLDSFIKIHIFEDKEHLSVHVIDQGPGFDPTKIESIYSPSHRFIQKGQQGEIGGGLSLAVARKFLKKLKAELQLSQNNETTLSIRFYKA